MRNREWFAKHLPILEDTWNQVIYYRQHLDEVEELKEIAHKKRNFWRYKPIIEIKSKEISKNKIKFLEEDKNEDKKENLDDFDFID
jgi:hypothetical protein